ncbi:hypothetical protein DSL72_003233 [Monilinia vaccinii-corymbosi]|uniref:Uncharacterized protein n=1 Tax=Monilinia vaccinii-corymbosi TaxID=61207 RepID=A0A8A3P1Q9_9HELO|nr:hypothetical protein DSL72_003233 [Monilinia vaccinii-corymbosi]
MEEQNLTDFSSNRAEMGSARRRSSNGSETQSHQTSNEEITPSLLPSSRYEEYQEMPCGAIASAPSPQATYSAPSLSSYQTTYSESSIQPSYPTLFPPQQYPPTTQSGSAYHTYLQPYTTLSQEPANSSPYPNTPPLAVPTPPSSHHITHPPSPYTSRYNQQAQYNQTCNQLPQSLNTALPHAEEQGPWSPLSRMLPPRGSRKRRVSEAEAEAETETVTDDVLGVSGENLDWGYKDKMGQELDYLEAELGGQEERA